MTTSHFSKLDTGVWGVRVTSDAPPSIGDSIEVSKRNGNVSTVVIESVLSSAEGPEGMVHTCAIANTRKPRHWESGGTPDSPAF